MQKTYRPESWRHMAKKTYDEYVSRWEHEKCNRYILQDEECSDTWDHVKINLFNTEDVRTEQNVKTDQDSRWEEDVKCVHKTNEKFFSKNQ